MNILFTICGRAGSKGIKNKNFKSFLGYPLPFYTVSIIDLYRKQYGNIKCDVVLNTDSMDLIHLFKEELALDIEIIQRDPQLALDNTSKVDVIRNCLEIIQQRRTERYDMVVDLDITAPLRKVEDINNLITKKANTNAEIIFSVTESRRNPYFNMVKRVIASQFNARQDAPEIFDMNASLYAYSPKFLESHKGIFDGKCDVIKMVDTAVLDLDHENDFELMQVIAKYLYEKYPEFNNVRSNIRNILKTG